jgi:hypothetical protein
MNSAAQTRSTSAPAACSTTGRASRKKNGA